MSTGAVHALQRFLRLFRAEAYRVFDHHLGQSDDGIKRPRFTKTFLDNPADGVFTDRSGLYLIVRNNSKARSWDFRRRGKHKTIGSALYITLEQAQERVQELKAKLKAGEDPMAPAVKGAVWTYQDEANLFLAHKCKQEWNSDDAQRLGTYKIKRYVTNTPYAKEPFVNLGLREFIAIFRHDWTAAPVLALRGAYMVASMIKRAQRAHPPRYPTDKKNPIDLTKDGDFRIELGKQKLTGHRLGLEPEKLAKLVAFLWQPPMAHDPDECTTSEAAEAIGCSPQSIFTAWRAGKLKTRRKLAAPYDHLNASWVWKIAELEKIFPLDRKKLKTHAEVDAYAYALLFTIYTAVRPEMATGLLWSEINWSRGYIDFGERHKMAERDPEADYTIPLTSGLREILEKQKDMQQREGIKTPLVFVHGYKRIGGYYFHGKSLTPHQLNQYLKRVLILLDLVEGETDPKKMPSASGFRVTFPEWAGELSELDKYRLEFVEAQLGHKIGVNNWMYYRNVTYIRRRGTMMKDYETYCNALRGSPIAPTNLVELKHARSIVGRR